MKEGELFHAAMSAVERELKINLVHIEHTGVKI